VTLGGCAGATDNWLLSVEMLRASRGRTLFEKRELCNDFRGPALNCSTDTPLTSPFHTSYVTDTKTSAERTSHCRHETMAIDGDVYVSY
jgi:hypothetical protein